MHIRAVFQDRWPKVTTNDPTALSNFADFQKAIPYVKSLALRFILNDCVENHKLLKKLAEWLVHIWSHVVVDELDTW